ncbi:MAG: pyrroline-5-carboxylate reductase [Alphaproteobacteria bacterium]|nr:MAG: pyrroline-5-carboxylate reductase [Alphaproteobacteria bacterium]
MQTDNKFFDDLAKLGQSAVGTLHGVKGEVEAMIRARLEHMLKDMDMVSREEFDVVRDMVKAARAENAALEKKIAALEKSFKPGKTKSSKK